jgi:ribose/xylose/arabinose/galactoside ABC-type transport system permease subunit
MMNKEHKLQKILTQYGLYFAFALLIIVMTVLSPAFLRPANLLNVLRQTSINGIIAIGMTMVILTGGIDLSVGSVLALSAVIATSFAHPGEHNLIVPLAIGLLVGLVCGLINGFIIASNKIAPFIVTLAMMTIARGLALVYTNGRPVIELSDTYNKIGSGYIIGVPIPVIIFVLIVLAGIFLLKYTKFGRHIYATGGNELAAKISGVNTTGVIVWVYSIAGLLSGLAGIVLSARVMSASPATGQGYELDAIAAVVIGGTKLTGGVGSIAGTIIGALIIGVMNNGLDLLNISSYWQLFVKGVIILLAVILDKKK